MMNDVIRISAPAPKPQPIAEQDPRLKKLRSLRDGLQRNTKAVTSIIDELIAELEEQEAA